jgi:cytochrome c-type biogenesis protein
MAAVAALALLLAALIPAAALAACPSPRASLPDIEDEVMCTVCGTPLNLAQAPQADAERAYIQQQIDACATKGQIKDRLVTEYGAAVLATPSDSGFDLAAWIVPGLVVLVALGMFATGLGAPLADNRDLLNKIAGVLLIVMGALFLLIPRIPALNRELRPDGLLHKAVAVGPVLAGGAFAFGWTPCTGPILGAILNAAATKDSVGGGAFLLTFYSLGLAVPFLLTALAVNRATETFRWIRSHYGAIMAVSGVILIIVGVLVATDQMTRLNTEARAFLDSVGLQGLVDAIEM